MCLKTVHQQLVKLYKNSWCHSVHYRQKNRYSSEYLFFLCRICASNLCHLELTARMRLLTGSPSPASGGRGRGTVSRKKHRALRPLQGKQGDNVSDRSQVRVLFCYIVNLIIDEVSLRNTSTSSTLVGLCFARLYFYDHPFCMVLCFLGASHSTLTCVIEREPYEYRDQLLFLNSDTFRKANMLTKKCEC